MSRRSASTKDVRLARRTVKYDDPPLPAMLGKRDRFAPSALQVSANAGGAQKGVYDPALANQLNAARVANQAVEAYLEAKQNLEEADTLGAEGGDGGDPSVPPPLDETEAQEQVITARMRDAARLGRQPSASATASGITMRPKRPSVVRRLAHIVQKARRPVLAGDAPRYWDCLGGLACYSRAPKVGDVFYEVARAFDSPFEGEQLGEACGLDGDCTSARAIRGFHVTAVVDRQAVVGHNKMVRLTLTAKRAGAEAWAMHGLQRRDVRPSVLNSTVPSRLKPYHHRRLPEGVVDCVLTADKGFYFRATRKGQKVDLDVVVPAGAPIPRATSWNQERSDYKEPLLESLAANAVGFVSRSLKMRMIEAPGTPVAFGIRSLHWLQNTQMEWLAKVSKPLDVMGGRPSVLNGVPGLYKEWRPPQGSLYEFMNR